MKTGSCHCGAVKFTVEGEPAQAIEHRFCTRCGTQPFAYGKNPKDGSEVAAVNIRCLDDLDLDAVERVPVNGREF